MRIVYIYQNQINFKIYVGQTKNLKKRAYQHKYESFKRSRNYPLYNSIRKYGIDKFNIFELEMVEDIDADESEQFWIQFFRSWDRSYGYNIEQGGCENKTLSEVTRKKMSETKKQMFKECPELNPMLGKHHTKETKEAISNANIGKCYNTTEHMEKLHKMTGDRLRGKHLSQEVRDKISDSHKGLIASNEAKRKMSETRIERGTFAGENNPNFGKVGDLNPASKLNWEIVNSIRLDYSQGLKGKKLMQKYNISETNMYRILKNETWMIERYTL